MTIDRMITFERIYKLNDIEIDHNLSSSLTLQKYGQRETV